ncbi:MAG: N-acetyltransferase, partial [bacterium]|nr:N-acetyltransferase [bacterium]
MTFEIISERPNDAVLINPLLDRTFGFDRTAKTVYRLRARIEPLADLRSVAVHADGSLLGSLRFWPIRIEATPAILLGPLAVEPALQGQGIGKALLHHGLTDARRAGHGICIGVGDPGYYRPFGFANAPSLGLVLPGPVELPRFQVLE